MNKRIRKKKHKKAWKRFMQDGSDLHIETYTMDNGEYTRFVEYGLPCIQTNKTDWLSQFTKEFMS